MKTHVHKTFEKFVNDGKSDTITVYHGTNYKHVASIRRGGLKNNNGYTAGWYMVSTDLTSALYHTTPAEEDFAYIFEFEIPCVENDRWKGYPYLWLGQKRNDNSTWFGIMRPIPSKFIKKIHKIPYAEWREVKGSGF